MSKVVTFGELMLRLQPYNYERFVQCDHVEFTFGGGEANVAVSLANYGLDAAFVTKLPAHAIGQTAVNSLRRYGVDTSMIVRGGDRVGIYFNEKGASQRGSVCIYDRAHSAIQEASTADFDWDKIFEGADWFHFTGITPALGPNVVEMCKAACKAAKAKGVKISCDLNYRGKLWTRDQARTAMTDLCQYVDVCISNEEDAKDVFGILPDACAVVIDEAHKLPETARQMFGTTLEAGDIRDLIDSLRRERFLLAAESLTELSGPLLRLMAQPFDGERCYNNFARLLLAPARNLHIIQKQLQGKLPVTTFRQLKRLASTMELLTQDNSALVFYVMEDHRGGSMLCAVAADMTAQLRSTLWNQERPAILTSATLAVGTDFHRFKEETGLLTDRRVIESVSPSPFDYKSNCLLYLPLHPPEQADGSYFDVLAAEIAALADASWGHALVLFTSYAAMSAVKERLTDMALAVAEYLRSTYPDIPGFSPRNLRRMRDFYRTYADTPEVMEAAMAVGWTQNIVILEAELTTQERVWYIRAVRRFGWSKAELQRQIGAGARSENNLDSGDETCDTPNNTENTCEESRAREPEVNQVHCLRYRGNHLPRPFPDPQEVGKARDRLHRQNGPPAYICQLLPLRPSA